MSEFKYLLDPQRQRTRGPVWLQKPGRVIWGSVLGLFFLYVLVATVRLLAWGEEDAAIQWFNEIASRPIGSFQFASPRWLLWLLPAWVLTVVITRFSVAGLRIWRRRFVMSVRLLVITVAILILAELQWVTFSDNLSVIFLIDHSRSVPEGLQKDALAYVQKGVTTKEADDRAGLVYFGAQAYPVSGLTHLFSVDDRTKAEIGDDRTNIARALQTAQSMFPRGSRRRIVLFTDGRETEGEALEQVKRMHHEDIRIDVVPLVHPMKGEIIAEKLDMPAVVNSDQPFDAELYVNAYQRSPVKIQLTLRSTDGKTIPYGEPFIYPLEKGANRITIPNLRLKEPAFYRYEARITPLNRGDDTISENNTVYGSTQIKGDNRVLILVGADPIGGDQMDRVDVKPLQDALASEGIEAEVRRAGDQVGEGLPRTLEDLQPYDCFILVNISKEDLGDSMLPMKTAVNDLGCGLIMIGGKDSFGAGGYLHTPIEDILPVSCETEDKKVMLNGALVIVLHTCEFADGNMWAIKIAKITVDTLSIGDYFGAIEYGWGQGTNWVVDLAPIINKLGIKAKIDKSSPGDMPDFDTVVRSADAKLAKVPSVGAKRILIISDGDPSQPLPSTIASLKQNQISLSFVGINPHGGVEITSMQAVAKATGGNYYFCRDPDHLPRIFQHEAAIVRKKLIVESGAGFTPVRTNLPDPARLIENIEGFPKVFGLNRTMTRNLTDNATVLLEVKLNDKESLPLLAYRRVGLGKTVAFTSDLSGGWGREWIAQDYHRKLWSEIVRKVARAASTGTHSVRLTNRDGKCLINIEVRDKNNEFANFALASGSVVDPDMNPIQVQFKQDGAGSYVAEFPLTKTGTYRVFTNVVGDDGQTSTALTGISYNYSEEFRQLEVNMKKLEQMVSKEYGNGRKIDIHQDPLQADLFSRADMRRGEDVMDLKDALLWLLIVLVLFDVFFRRVYLDFDSFAVWGMVQVAKVLPFMREGAQASLKRLDTLTPALQAARDRLDEQQKAAQAARRQALLEKIEKEGGSGDFNLDLDAIGKGGTGTISGPQMADKVKKPETKPAQSASEYTNRLLAAKRRAKKDLE